MKRKMLILIETCSIKMSAQFFSNLLDYLKIPLGKFKDIKIFGYKYISFNTPDGCETRLLMSNLY